jgi:two-component system cell cycle sensor histidine kinase/response regulator CckA
MAGELLEGLGYRVTVAGGSMEALKLFKADPSRFDVVFTDQTMPGMTGLQLAQELLMVRPDIPVIICTGHSQGDARNSAMDSGVKVFAMKPLTKAELAKTMRVALDE